jgi:multicomponent Na+:H+ antiporter subunit C
MLPILANLPYATALFLIVLGSYTLLVKENLIKKIIGLGIVSNGIHLFVISLGYREGGIAPLLENMGFTYFLQHAVDPLPQALILTSIVINLSVIAVALSLVIHVYRKTGSIEAKDLRRLRG